MVRRIKDVLWVLACLGVVAGLIRLGVGLGPSTGLSDEVPWGFWKVLNMIAGVALATGGFVLAFCVHVLHIKSLKPILRPALLVAFLGYGSSCTALLLDIGLPHRFWHPIFYWNVHSFLFEVFWCVLLYFTVTALEVSPIALEDSPFAKLRNLLKKIGSPVVIVGITLSSLHHSSLGSLFIMSKGRLHEIWWTPWLPVLFIVSAVGAGMMAVALVTLVAAKLYRREAPMGALRKVAGAAAVILSLSLVLRVVDLLARGAVGSVLSGAWEGNFAIVEILCAAVIPVAIVAVPRFRASGAGIATAASFAVIGLVLNRTGTGIFGYLRSGGTSYVPTLAELAVTVGIPAAAGIVFLAFVERFRVFGFSPVSEGDAEGVTDFDPQTRVWRGVLRHPLERVSLIAVVAVPVALLAFVPFAGAGPDATSPVAAPRGLDDLRETLLLDGDRDGDGVRFKHGWHVEQLGGDDSCARCHHLDRPGDRFSACHHCHADMSAAVSIFDHELHVERIAARAGHTGVLAGNHACIECHERDRPAGPANAKSCVTCHEEDMRMGADFASHRARSYVDALHESCVGCHDERAAAVGRPRLGECETCHR